LKDVDVNILRVIHSINPASGGPMEAIKSAGLTLPQLGHYSEVASLDAPDSSWLQAFPIKVHALGPGLSSYGFSHNLVPWLRRNVHRYDCVIIDGIWQYSSFGTWLALHNNSIPYFVYLHGMLDPWFKRTFPLKHLKKSLYWPWADYKVLRDATAVLFASHEEKILAPQSFQRYQCNEVVVNYSVPSADIAQQQMDAVQQRQLFLSLFPELQGKRLILFLARIHPKKGCDLLIKAFARLADSDERLHLVMAGPDQVGWQKQLQQQVQQLNIYHRVTWTGLLEGDLKWGAFHASEVFVLSSHQENFGIAIAEAMSCSLPVLISNKINIWREIVEDGAGLVANDDVESTTQLLNQWLQMPLEQQQEMAKKARQSFLNRFEINQSVTRLIDTLNSFGVGG
jgi:glycosyltransferase involved in cell wall biosynthesis